VEGAVWSAVTGHNLTPVSFTPTAPAA